ncbi:MAG TPA: glycosyl hydrolase family 28-related protein, partial [Methylobacter sp.]
MSIDPVARGMAESGIKAAANVAAIVAGLTVGAGAVINVKAAPYSAAGDGTTDDTAAIQAALNAAASTGYGQVYAPSSVYYCTGGLLVPSGVHFYGDGPDATIIRNPAGALPGITLSGITAFATICSIQSVGSRVSDLCVDHITNGCTSNGISFVAASGYLSTDYTIERCKVLGYDSHQYLIWGLRVNNAVIRDNIIIGGGSQGSTSQSEGIEIFGGNYVEITGNYVSGMGSDCINLVEDSGTPNTTINNLNIHHNTLIGAGRGVNISVISNGSGFIISDNIILNQYLSG